MLLFDFYYVEIGHQCFNRVVVLFVHVRCYVSRNVFHYVTTLRVLAQLAHYANSRFNLIYVSYVLYAFLIQLR